MACCGAQAVRLQNKVRDPLCGASVDVNSPYRMDNAGRSHRFCSEACKDDYSRVMQGEAVPGVVFECVMHPEARQDQPGECALCGIALAPARNIILNRSAHRHGEGLLGRLRSALRL